MDRKEKRLIIKHKERGSPLAWFSSELKSGERMLMICRKNEARPDESPANVFINTEKLGNK